MSGEEYKRVIMDLINLLDNSDRRFLIQLYTIIKRHLQRRGR